MSVSHMCFALAVQNAFHFSGFPFYDFFFFFSTKNDWMSKPAVPDFFFSLYTP